MSRAASRCLSGITKLNTPHNNLSDGDTSRDELTIDELDAVSGGSANDLPKEIGCTPGTLVCCPPGGCGGGGTNGKSSAR